MNELLLPVCEDAHGRSFSMGCSRRAQEARVSAVLASVTAGAAGKNVAVAVTSVEVVAAVEAQVGHHTRSDGHGNDILLVILDGAEESAPAVLVVVAGAALARRRTRWHWRSTGIDLLGSSLEVSEGKS